MSIELICPIHNGTLDKDNKTTSFICKKGCAYPIINSVPRFVSSENYASGFGLQWNEFRTTQLDSYTGVPISKNRLERILGGSIDIVAGKKVLEAGCGAGRFSELLLESGAHLCAVDISTAVEANIKNCHTFNNYFVSQADIMQLPFREEQFDIVICIGVIQHTPNPEKTIEKLCNQVKPGGLLFIDHYTHGYPLSLSRRIIRAMLIKMPSKVALVICKVITATLWPLHKFLWDNRNLTGFGLLRAILFKISPIVDYHDAYIELGPELLKTWALLDTHDTLTDYHKHLRSAEEIHNQLTLCGMKEISTRYAGNGVEAVSKKEQS